MHELQNFIGGTFRPPREDRWYTSDDPASGQPGTRMPNSTESDVNDAVDAAAAAFTTWSKTTLQDRSKILLLIAAGIEAQLEAFAVAESEDQGKPISVARQIDIPRAIHNFRYFGQHILTETESVSYGVPQHMSYTRKMPAGVAALISPWNLPLYLLTWKIAPCLAYGCTCVCKPSEFTSRTASMLCQVLKDAGVPDGVVNMVFGDGPSAGQPLIEHPQVPLISFTGGTVTGKRIYERAAACVKRLSLELGGKNAVLVFDDADFAKLIPTVVRSSFSNQGEICLCGSRLFVQRGVYERFVAALTEATRQLRVGHPADAATQMGPLVSKPHYEKVLGYIELAKQLGGTIVTGGHPVTVPGYESGYYLAPTIITDVDPSSRICQEEIFGPVITICPFDTEAEALRYANDSMYGLSACIWTSHLSRAHRVAAAIQAAYVWINCWMVRDLTMPFGGMKGSGLGREGGQDSSHFFCESKTICLAE